MPFAFGIGLALPANEIDLVRVECQPFTRELTSDLPRTSAITISAPVSKMVVKANRARVNYLRRVRLESSQAVLVRDAARATDHVLIMAAKESRAYARQVLSKVVAATSGVALQKL